MKKTYLILIVLGLIPFVLASDVSVWQGQYYTGTTFNTGTYGFNFSVYDALTGGNICFSNTTTLTTGNWGEWKTEHSGVSSSCNNASVDYFLNVNIDGVDQIPRRRLVFFNFLRKDVNETANINIASYNLTANNGFFSYLGILTNRIIKLFVQDIDASGNITANYFIGSGSQLTGLTAILSGGEIYHLPYWTGVSTLGNSRFVEQSDGIVGISSDNSTEPIPFVFKVNSTSGHAAVGGESPEDSRYVLQIQKTFSNSPSDIAGIYNRIVPNPTTNSSQNFIGIISKMDYSSNYILNGSLIGLFSYIVNNGNGTFGSPDNPVFGIVGETKNSQNGFIHTGTGVLGMIENTGNGNIDTAIGVYGLIDNSGGGN